MNEVSQVHIFIIYMHSDYIESLGGFIGFDYWKYKIIQKSILMKKKKLFLELYN